MGVFLRWTQNRRDWKTYQQLDLKVVANNLNEIPKTVWMVLDNEEILLVVKVEAAMLPCSMEDDLARGIDHYWG